MELRILDLDGAIRSQISLLQRSRPRFHDLRAWGPQIRLGCRFGHFEQFETALARTLGSASDDTPVVNLLGSGDFHHVTLALLRRIEQPFNLLILDNHPDWMRGIPFLHCGTWVHHAAQLANVRTIFHVGGDVDFDNTFRWLTPWRALRSGKIHIISAIRRFERGPWAKLAFPALRTKSDCEATPERIQQLLEPLHEELARWPLYVSLDKDVMTTKDAVVNWDSGHLTLGEVENVLSAFRDAADHRLVGMDVLGDWSQVRLQGWGRRLAHLTEHPRLDISPLMAARCNERTNLKVMEWANKLVDGIPAPGTKPQGQGRPTPAYA